MPTASMSTSRSKPPPLWLVTNGLLTVGPVNTRLLVRGVLHEMIPDDCLVREQTWTRWRNVETIREIVALRRAQARYGAVEIVPEDEKKGPSLDPYASFREHLHAIRESSATLVDALLEAVRKTGACVGAVHRRRTPYVGFVTSAVTGPGMISRLGSVLPAGDAALSLARRGETLSEAPRAGAASGRVSERLGTLPASAGVLVVPVLRQNGLEALLELGRPDHPFREWDTERAVTIAAIAASRLDWLGARRGS